MCGCVNPESVCVEMNDPGHLLQAFDGFNSTPDEDTERMVQFHIFAANTQLRQVYYGFIAAMGLERSLVMPKVT